MTLSKILERMQPTDYIKIGTEGGTNFIYAGDVGSLAAETETMTGKLRRNTKYKYEKAKLNYAASYSRWRNANQKDGRSIAEWNSAQTNLARAREAYENFKPLPEREVLDAFYAHPIIDDVEHVLVVNVTRTEDGRLQKIDKDGKGVVMY